MTEYFVPTGPGEAEFTEKRSRFIGRLQPIDTEAEARAFLEDVRKKHHDARHNCWCWLLRSGTGARYSDDGEPQGTAGLPMLGVLEQAGVTNLCCVVTRYFGGTLLGTGGLVRAYSRAAKEALDAAGISVVRSRTRLRFSCPYGLYDRLRREAEAAAGTVENTAFAAEVTLTVLVPEEGADPFSARIIELSAGTVTPEKLGQALLPVPVRPPKD